MHRRSLLLGAATGVLAACGGGSVAVQPPAQCVAARLVSVYGDSVQSGSYGATPTAPQRSYLNPRPSQRIAQAAGVRVIDHAIPGWTAAEWSQGWASTVATDPADTVVLRLGGADAVALTDPVEFEIQFAAMVDELLRVGRRVLVVGVIRTALRPAWQEPIGLSQQAMLDIEARAVALDQACRRVAQSRAVGWVDVRALPFDAGVDIADAVHPAQGYADRCADLIADAVTRIT